MQTLTPLTGTGLAPLPVAAGSPGPPPLEAGQLAEAQDRVIAFTSSVFGVPASLFPAVDPEYDEAYFAVKAIAAGSVEEIVRRNDQWHRGIAQHAGDFALKFRLALSIE